MPAINPDQLFLEFDDSFIKLNETLKESHRVRSLAAQRAAERSVTQGYLPGMAPDPPPAKWWQFWNPAITPEQACRTLRVSSGIGLAASLFTGGFGANFDTALMIGGILTLVPGMQWLLPIVAAGYLFKAGQHAVQGLGCLFGGLLGGETDIQGALMNFGTAFLVAICAFPVAKSAQVYKLFKTCPTTGQFLTEATKLCYGEQAAAQLAGKLEMFSANPAARQAALANGRVGLERARDAIYSFFNPAYGARQSAATAAARTVTTPAGYQMAVPANWGTTPGGVLYPMSAFA